MIKRLTNAFAVIGAFAILFALGFAGYLVWQELKPSVIEGRNVSLFYVPIAPGCWTIDISGPDNESFLLVGQKTAEWNPSRDDGRRINFKARRRDELVTTCMTGRPLEIITYEFVPKPH